MDRKAPLTRAEESALIALRQERPLASFARNALGDLVRRGFAERAVNFSLMHTHRLTPAGEAAADKALRELSGLGDIIRKPDVREADPWKR